MKLREFKCKNCGGELQFLTSEKILSCVFCGTKYFLEDAKEVEFKNPDGIILFKSNESGTQKALVQWLKKDQFSPDDIDKINYTLFSGVYIPLYLFKIKYSVDWTATSIYYEEETYDSYVLDSTGERTGYQVQKTRRVEKSKPSSGRINLKYDHIEIVSQNIPSESDFCRSVYNKYKNKISDFSENSVKGFQFEPFSIVPKDCYDKVEKSLSETIEKDIAETIPGDSYKELSWSIDDTDIKESRYYIPVWIANFEYGEKKFQCFIDGVNHEIITGTKPEDETKVAKAKEEEQQKEREKDAEKEQILSEYRTLRNYSHFSYLILLIYLLAFYIFNYLFYRSYLYFQSPLKTFVIFLIVGTIGWIIFLKITKAVRNKIIKDSEKFLREKGSGFPPESPPKAFFGIFKIIFIIMLLYSIFLIYRVEKFRGTKFPGTFIQNIKQKINN